MWRVAVEPRAVTVSIEKISNPVVYVIQQLQLWHLLQETAVQF